MNKKSVLVFLAIVFSSNGFAGQTAIPRLSVKTLIANYTGQIGTPLHEQSADAMIKMQFADGYLAGVADGSQGKIWCDTGKVKVGEINSMIVAELRMLSSKDQNQSAAQGASKILKIKLPCKQSGQKT